MPVFERKHSLAPDIFYKLAKSAYTPDSDNRRNERKRSASDTVYKSSGGETVHKTSEADDVPKKRS